MSTKRFFRMIGCLLNFLLIFVLVVSFPALGQNKVELESLDGNIVYTFQLTEEAPVYEVDYKGKPLIGDSKLGLSFKGEDDFKVDLRMEEPEVSKVDDKYELVVEKA